jgi:hypothetical protein
MRLIKLGGSKHVMYRNLIKILVFVTLVGGFCWFAWGTDMTQTERSRRKARNKATACFVVGAAVALWGDKRMGNLDPISLRGIFVVLGVALMLFGFLLARTLRETTQPRAALSAAMTAVRPQQHCFLRSLLSCGYIIRRHQNPHQLNGSLAPPTTRTLT